MRPVYILGYGQTSFSRRARDGLAEVAIGTALEDAAIGTEEIDSLVLAAPGRIADSATAGLDPDLEARRMPYCFPNGLAALRAAWWAVATESRDCVLCAGEEPVPGDDAPPCLEDLAAVAADYMRASGATEEHLVHVVMKNRSNGAANPHALYANGVEFDEILGSEMLAWPLRRSMVSTTSQGAAALVLGSEPREGSRALRIRASVLVRGDDRSADTARAGRMAYQAAGVGPEELGCAELDSPTAACELAAYELLQLVPPGRGPELLESGFTGPGGVVPCNTSGGALAQGFGTVVGPIAQLCELAAQLRREAGARQVRDCDLALSLARVPCNGERREHLISLTIVGVDEGG